MNFNCADGSCEKVYDKSFIVRNETIKLIRLIAAIKDITHLRTLKKELHNIELKNTNEIGKNLIISHENDCKTINDEWHEDKNQLLASINF